MDESSSRLVIHIIALSTPFSLYDNARLRLFKNLHYTYRDFYLTPLVLLPSPKRLRAGRPLLTRLFIKSRHSRENGNPD
jgi:hypothetical protein